MALDLTGASPTYNSSGKFGASFNGGTASRTQIIPSSGSFTLEGFIKTTDTSGTKVALGSANTFWIGKGSSNTIELHYGSGGTEVVIQSGVSASTGAWIHVEWDYNATTGSKFFVAGNLAGSDATLMGAAGASYSSAFGVRTFAGVGSAYDWIGEVDEVALWSTIQHTTTFTPRSSAISNSSSGLIALYHFDNDLLDSTTAGATAVTMTGPTTGASGSASTNFTVGANGTITGTVVVTPSDSSGGGTFTPTTVSISSGSPTGTFTYTPGSTGTKTISVTNNGGLTNPSNISYVSTAPVKYTLVDTTDTIGAQNIRVLVPNSNAAVPYNSANPTGVILHVHGMGEDQTGILTDSLKATCIDALLDAGYIIAASNARGDSFGIQAAVDDYAALAKYVRDNYNVSKICLWSQSMGGLPGLLAISQNKIPGLAGWLGTYPMCSLSANYTSAGGTDFSSYINTAYGITGSGIATYANKTYGNDPALKPASAFRHLPMRFYASASDLVVKKDHHTDVLQPIIAGSCRENTIVVCSGNHGDASHFQPSDYVAFFARCFATPIADSGMLGAVQPTTTKTITVTFQKHPANGGTLQANLTGLNWEWSDVNGQVIDTGTGATTNSSGVFSITVHTALATAGIGYLKVSNTVGAINTTDVAFDGPVAVP